MVLLLFLIQVVNYADKSVAGLTAHDFSAELGLTPTQYGLVASSFFSLYAITGLLVAFLAAPRVRPRILLAILLLAWSVCQLPIVFAAALPTLLACRTALGMAEGAGTPTSFNVCHEWFASEDRNMPSATIMFGSFAGSLIAAPSLSLVIHHLGWRAAFLTCGIAGFVLLGVWLLLSKDGPGVAPTRRGPRVLDKSNTSTIRMRDLWVDGTVLGNLLAGLTAYWVMGFSISWLAPFVRETGKFDVKTTGWLLSLSYAGQAAILLGASFLSQRLLKHGTSSRIARGLIMAGCLLGSGTMFIVAAFLTDPVWRLSALTAAIGFASPLFSLSAAMLSEISPVQHRNQLMSIMMSAITVSAIFAPLPTGALLQTAGGWQAALLVNAAVPLVGGVASLLLLRPEATTRRLAGLEASAREIA